MDDHIAAATDDLLEQILCEAEAAVARLRAVQASIVVELDRRQVATADGCHSTAEWVAGRLDLAPGDDLLDMGRRFDITGLRRRASRVRRMTRHDERRAFADRYLVVQPSLDESAWRLHGLLPGADGCIVERALDQRADGFPLLPGGTTCSRGQRHADALVSLATDSLGGTGDGGGAATPLVTVFVDAAAAASTGGEAGAAVAAGPRVGPGTLQELLCGGAVEVVATTAHGTPLAVGRSSRLIPPRLRRWVLHRDGCCTADGCTSRHRLQAHHVTPWSEGGPTDPGNLTTLCWFHHHVVVHGMGHAVDPASPPGRRRFLRPGRGSGPP